MNPNQHNLYIQQQDLQGSNHVLQSPMIQQQYGGQYNPMSTGGSMMPAGMLALTQRMMPQQNPQQQYNTTGLQGNAQIPWAVTSEEKSQYREIFRAWDATGHGYITGKIIVSQ